MKPATEPTAAQQIANIQQQQVEVMAELIAVQRREKQLSDTYDALSNALTGVQLGQGQEKEARLEAEAIIDDFEEEIDGNK